MFLPKSECKEKHSFLLYFGLRSQKMMNLLENYLKYRGKIAAKFVLQFYIKVSA